MKARVYHMNLVNTSDMLLVSKMINVVSNNIILTTFDKEKFHRKNARAQRKKIIEYSRLSLFWIY